MGSGIPLFQPGDRDVLLVHQNGISACPLIGCSRGRYRIVGDTAYPDNGRGAPVPELRRARINGVVLEQRASDLAGESLPRRGTARGMRTAELRAMLRAAVEQAHTPEELASLRPARSGSPEERFTIPWQLAATPREPAIEASAPRSPEDQREYDALERDRHRPVLQQKQ
jgi:hypothetical protein